MVKKNILFKMTLREIKNNFKQYIALIVISFLAVTLFIGLDANAISLQNRVDTLYENGNIADVFVYVKSTNAKDKNYLLSLDTTDKVEERVSLSTSIDGHNGTLIINDKFNELSTYSSLTKESVPGLLVDTHYQDMYNKKIGDDIYITLPISLKNMYKSFVNLIATSNNVDYETANNLVLSYLKEGKENPFESENIVLKTKITGFMLHPEAVEVSSSNVVTCLSDKDLMNELFTNTINELINTSFNDNNYTNTITSYLSHFSLDNFNNQYLIKIKEGNSLKDINQKINDYFNSSTNDNFITSLTKDNLPATITLESDVKQAKQLTIVFPLIFFIVAILVVLTSLSQLIFHSRSDIGILKAIGVSKIRILFHYVSFGVILCFIGSFLGSIVGPLLIPKILDFKYSILYILPKAKIVFPWKTIIICSIAFCLSSGLVSYLVSRSEVNLKPVESTRPKVIKSKKNSKKDVNHTSPLKLSLRMTFRNMFSNLSRTLMVIFGVLGCTALLISGFGIMDTVNYGVNLDFNEHDLSHISLTYASKTNKEKDAIKELDNIKQYAEYMVVPLQVKNQDSVIETTLQVLEEDNYTFDFAKNINKGVALSTYTASKLKVEVNDSIELIYQGEKVKLNVDYLFPSSYLLKIYTLNSNFSLEKFTPSGANIILNDTQNVTKTKQDIENLKLNLASLNTNVENQKRIKEILGSVEIMCNTIKVFAILLSIVVTYNLALLNFNDRKRDIATLKVIGCSNKEIMFSLIGEIMILTLIGCIAGIFGGYPLLVIILKVNQTELFHFLYHIYLSSYLISVLISLGSSIIVNILLGKLSYKVDAVSALKSVE